MTYLKSVGLINCPSQSTYINIVKLALSLISSFKRTDRVNLGHLLPPLSLLGLRDVNIRMSDSVKDVKVVQPRTTVLK